jgi:ribosomal protein S27AE
MKKKISRIKFSLVKELHCPRCKNKNVIAYKDTFDCPKCKLEFDKKDLDLFDDEDIMSIEEKKDFFDAFGGEDSIKKIFD